MARLDAFDRDAEAKPPDGELREIEQRIGAGERHAVVGADGKRQPAVGTGRRERSVRASSPCSR
jgi:hypothetical protein